ncbi:MAG: hypothetical protein PUK16_08005 [Prevotellaceae bacterium]|nr:hypothetical protein [Prevotellaceae bacterium]
MNRKTLQKNIRRRIFSLLGMLMIASLMQVNAQNVTISPRTGKMIAALTYQNEVGFKNGWSAMWRHDQLPLTMVVADDGDLTPGGELKIPAGNMNKRNEQIVFLAGQTKDLYFTISLPKGYRITGYKMVFFNNLNGVKLENFDTQLGWVNKRLYETNRDFNINAYKARTDEMPSNNDNKEYVIQRTSATTTDMGNQLYFRLYKGSANAFFGVTVKSIEIFYTAEGTFEESVAPIVRNTLGQHYVKIPFTTAKVDIGDIKPHTKDNKTFFSYDYRNVRDLVAYNVIYDADKIVDGKLPNNPGLNGKINSISNNNEMLFALKNGTYFVETPTEAATQDGAVNPIQFRIVGAKVNYTRGVNAAAVTNAFYITAQKNGITYYLGINGQFSENKPTLWQMDGNGYVYSGSTYLGRSWDRTMNEYHLTTVDDSNRAKFSINTYTNALETSWSSTTYTLHLDNSSSLWYPTLKSGATTIKGVREVVRQDAFTPAQSFTLKVYGTNGNTPIETVVVNAENPSGMVTLENLNNDAVKFVIEGLNANEQALVKVDLQMETLNPYINRLDLVCKEDGGQGRTLTQQFTANDFAVSGGKFIFYVPEDFTSFCFISFEDLFSNYGDLTYYNGKTNGHARYSLVKSPYWNTATSLYGEAYSPNADYKDKVIATVAGTQKFKFNNADELGNNQTTTQTKHYTEFPFSLDAYNEAGGTFNEVKINTQDQVTHNNYLFTCDETRYNIAPTTASEHRYYAYYQMDIEIIKKTYTPEIEWKKVYEADNTLMTDVSGAPKKKDQWGLVLRTTPDGDGRQGYLSVGQIKRAIEDKTGITPDQILYVDGGALLNIVNEYKNVGMENETDDLAELYMTLGKNALFYLPEGQTYNRDNFAFKTESGGFHSANNIILTDKAPFFAPHEIQVDAANFAKYTREVTLPRYENTLATEFNASVILPFTIDLQDGLHSNQGDNFKFTVNTMKPTGAFAYDKPVNGEAVDFTHSAVFEKLTADHSEANKPYMIHVTDRPQVAEGENRISFVVQAYGSNIAATPVVDGYIHNGESATGTANGNVISFENHGTFSGREFAKAENQIFYFANGRLLCIKNLMPSSLYVLPFRAYYTYTGNVQNVFGITFDDNGELTNVENTDVRADFAVMPGKGFVTVKANTATRVTIVAVDGSHVETLDLHAGESRTIAVPAGIYVVNGVKIIVR